MKVNYSTRKLIKLRVYLSGACLTLKMCRFDCQGQLGPVSAYRTSMKKFGKSNVEILNHKKYMDYKT